MNIVEREVCHKTWGVGIVEECSNGIIVVKFSEEKVARFEFPEAFAQGFLVANDMEFKRYVLFAIETMKCDICGRENVITEVVDNIRLCKLCKEEHTFFCTDCKRTRAKPIIEVVEDFEYPNFTTEICSECAEEKSFSCFVCDHRYYNKYKGNREKKGFVLCKACAERELEDIKKKRENDVLSTRMNMTLGEEDTLFVVFANDECDKHFFSPTLFRVRLNNQEEIFIEGRHCWDCGQNQIDRNTFAANNRYHEMLCCKYIIKGFDDISYDVENVEYRERNEESKLKKLGYSVSKDDYRTDAQRKEFLRFLIRTNQISKGEAIFHIESLIRINGRRETNAVALRKWKSDLEFLKAL